MVEMTETALIANNATDLSLVILDEIGRGTATYDGLSIAWSVVEHLHDQVGCRSLFATHYHELTQLAESRPAVNNYNIAVREWNDQIIFLRQIVPGAADKSYGIQVARLAGLPRSIIDRAGIILANLEEESISADGRPKFAGDDRDEESGVARQLYLFEADSSHPVLTELKNINLDHLTPFEAMQRLKMMKERVLDR